MRFTCGFAALLTLALAGSGVAQGDFAPGSCPGGMNLELTALTVPQPTVAPAPPPPRPKPVPVPEKPAPKPKKKRPTPQRSAAPAPQRSAAAPAPRPEPEPEPEPVAPPPPRRARTDAALDDMIGTFGSRPPSEPVIDYRAPSAPDPGIGERLRATAGFLDAISHERPRRPRRPTHDPAPRTTPQSTTPQSTVPQSLAHPESTFPVRVSPTRFDRQAVPATAAPFPELR